MKKRINKAAIAAAAVNYAAFTFSLPILAVHAMFFVISIPIPFLWGVSIIVGAFAALLFVLSLAQALLSAGVAAFACMGKRTPALVAEGVLIGVSLLFAGAYAVYCGLYVYSVVTSFEFTESGMFILLSGIAAVCALAGSACAVAALIGECRSPKK